MTIKLAEEKLQTLIKRILQAEPGVRKVLLFGSHITGKANTYSDIDVAVVIDDSLNKVDVARRIWRNMIGFGTPVDIVVVYEKELKQYANVYGLIYREIAQQGLVVYAKQ